MSLAANELMNELKFISESELEIDLNSFSFVGKYHQKIWGNTWFPKLMLILLQNAARDSLSNTCFFPTLAEIRVKVFGFVADEVTEEMIAHALLELVWFRYLSLWVEPITRDWAIQLNDITVGPGSGWRKANAFTVGFLEDSHAAWDALVNDPARLLVLDLS